MLVLILQRDPRMKLTEERMKKLLFIIISMVYCFILFGCESNSATITSEINNEVNNMNDKSADEHINAVEINDDISNEDYSISLSESMDEEYEVTNKITVTNEKFVSWSYTFECYPMTELDQCQEIGIINNNYLIIVSGRVYAFDIMTGELLWISEDSTGASCHYDFDDDNNLYICGVYGPDLLVIDSEGKTLYNYDSLSEYYWPYRIRYIDEMVFITYSSEIEDVTIKVDPKNGIARSAEDEEALTVVQTFESKYGSFEVTVPILWKCKEAPFYEATESTEAMEGREGSPDGGIQIFIDDESLISITVSRARIYYNGTFQENIQTDDGVTAKAYSYNNDGRINEIKFSDSLGVIINCNNDTYDKYESDIMDLVKTIKIK